MLTLAVLGTLYAFQQPFRQYPGQEYATFDLPPDYREKTEWIFARLMYPPHPYIGLTRTHGPWQNGWAAWTNDYPRADRHFTPAVRRLTRIHARSVEQPVNLDDGDDVYNYPWLYAVQTGSFNLTAAQAGKLRDYLLRGGFLVCDDFWGTREWGNFEQNMHAVFPDRPIVEMDDAESAFHTVYDLKKTAIPGEWSLRSGRPYRNDGVDPHWRAIYDDKGRMLVAIWFNIDSRRLLGVGRFSAVSGNLLRPRHPHGRELHRLFDDALKMNLLLLAALAFQLPASETLSPEDSKGFHAELQNLQKMLDIPGDHATVVYAIARTYAAGGQYQKAIEWLNKALALDVGIDPAPDKVFQKLRGTAEFEQIRGKARAATPSIIHSRIAFSIDEDDLSAEGIAYDARRKRFYIGSTAKHKIVECTAAGECRTFAVEQGLHEVLGIKINPLDGSLWTASNAEGESGLLHFAVPSGKLLNKYTLGKGHVFNDLAISAQGDVFVTDTRGSTVYWVSHTTNRLELLRADLRTINANGIALSEDGKKLYVSAFPDGITVIDVATRASQPIGHPGNLCLGSIDGLSFFKGSLIAIQNGVVADRVARFDLAPDQDSIASFRILERRHPQWDGITTGAIADGWYYFMANVDAVSHPTTILKLELRN